MALASVGAGLGAVGNRTYGMGAMQKLTANENTLAEI